MTNTAPKNPFTWIEIYVDDMSRAQKFYEAVFQISLSPYAYATRYGRDANAYFSLGGK